MINNSVEVNKKESQTREIGERVKLFFQSLLFGFSLGWLILGLGVPFFWGVFLCALEAFLSLLTIDITSTLNSVTLNFLFLPEKYTYVVFQQRYVFCSVIATIVAFIGDTGEQMKYLKH